MAKARRTPTTKTVKGPRPIAPVKSETERALESLARKARKLGGRAGALKVAKAPTAGAIELASLKRASKQIQGIKKRLERGQKRLSNEFKQWTEENPQVAEKRRPGQLGMAVKPKEVRKKLAESPVRARISEILAGKQVQAKLNVQRAADRARESLTKDLRGIHKVAKALGDYAQVAIAKAKEALVNLTARVVRGIAAERLFDTPVTDLRKRFDPRIMKTTPETAKSMIGVASSNVFSVGFEPHENDPNTGTLIIQFRSGWVYKYKDSPIWLYEGLLSASSPGRFVWQQIRRGLYPDGTPYGNLSSDGYTRIR